MVIFNHHFFPIQDNNTAKARNNAATPEQPKATPEQPKATPEQPRPAKILAEGFVEGSASADMASINHPHRLLARDDSGKTFEQLIQEFAHTELSRSEDIDHDNLYVIGKTGNF